MRMVYRYMVILCLFFIVPDTLRADGEDVLERMISLPKMKGTVYSLLGNISQQSGYLFIYDSKVVDNDVTVKIRKGERTIRQAIYEITGDTSLEFKVIGTHILITSSSPTKQQQAKPSCRVRTQWASITTTSSPLIPRRTPPAARRRACAAIPFRLRCWSQREDLKSAMHGMEKLPQM